MHAIEVQKLTKIIDTETVLEKVDLTVQPGEIVGMVGRNGSGKTMLMRAIAGLVRPSEGNVYVLGQEVAGDHIPPIGAIIESPGFLPYLSGLKNLELLASIRKKVDSDGIRKAMERVGLDPDLKKPVRKYSMGMRQKLGLAQAIMEGPEVLLLDEPTTGLDEDGGAAFHQLLNELKTEGTAILLASHIREEIDSLCDRVFHMKKGRLEGNGKTLHEVSG